MCSCGADRHESNVLRGVVPRSCSSLIRRSALQYNNAMTRGTYVDPSLSDVDDLLFSS